MKKLLTAGALAGAIAFTPALAAPAHAGNNHDDALLGLGLALALGTAIAVADDDGNRHKHAHYSKPKRSGHYHGKSWVYDDNCDYGKRNRHYKRGHDHHDHADRSRHDRRDYNRGRNDRRDDYRGHHDRRDHYRGYDNRRNDYHRTRFDQRDARRIAQHRYDVNVEKTARKDNRIIVNGWDRHGMWTRIAFHARTGEVLAVRKTHRRG